MIKAKDKENSMNTETPARYWGKVDLRGGDPGKCWEWQASTTSGYGQFWIRYRMWRSHRVAWILTYGPIPEGLHVCHHCDNKLCCNPYHLFLGTNLDNVRDSLHKGRKARKLSEEDVREIRRHLEVCSLNQEEIADLFGVEKSTISRIKRGRNWSWLET